MKPVRGCVGILAAALVALGLGGQAMGSAASRPRCPTGGKVLLRTASLRVYSVDGIGRACLFSSGRPYGLSGEDESFGEEEGKEFPLIAAAGPMVAAWIEGFYDPNFSEVFMRVINLRTRMLVRAVPYYTQPDVLRVAARSGAVVLGFIGCDQEGARRTSSRCDPSTIYAADGPAFDPRTSPYESDFPSEEPHRIAAGFDLDVTSLRITGRTVSWLDGGKRRTYMLPPARYPGEARCASRDRVLVRGPELLVTVAKKGYVACRYADGRRYVLGGEGTHRGLGHPVVIAGSMVAATIAGASLGTERIRVWDVQGRRLLRQVEPREYAAFGVAAGTGWLAVMTEGCTPPLENPRPDLVCEPTKVLVSDDQLPATTSRVRAPTGELREVAAGAGIDPESLQIVGQTVTWTDLGVRQHYMLGTANRPAAMTRSGSPHEG